MTGNSPTSHSLNEENAEEPSTDAMVGERPVRTVTPPSREGAVGGPQQAATTRAPVEEYTATGLGSGGGSAISTPEGNTINGLRIKGFSSSPSIESNLSSSKMAGVLPSPAFAAPPVPKHHRQSSLGAQFSSPVQQLPPIPPTAAEPTIISGTCTLPNLLNATASPVVGGSVSIDIAPSRSKSPGMGSNVQVRSDGHGEEGKTIFNSAPHQIEDLEVAEQEILTNIQELQRKLMELKTDDYQLLSGGTIAEQKMEGAAKEDENGLHDMRVIVVANRLPISVSEDPKTGKWKYEMTSGGLVTALKGTRDEIDFIWIGWIGKQVPEEEQEGVREVLLRDFKCVPVFLEDDLVDKYYNGFSNDILWPLFHYVPLPMFKVAGGKKFDRTLWEAYKKANTIFASVVSEVYVDGDFVWVHDYHLMRLPYELRCIHPHCRIGWFLHTPFPSSEMYRILPVRKPLLQGLLSADLVGFHTYDYARHFLSSCSRILEVKCSPHGIEHNNHKMSLGVFPIGIDPEEIKKTMRTPWVQNRIQELTETFKGRKVLFGVDRLDYIKGMPHKLLGLELFFKRYPEWHGRVTLIQVGVPSRVDVPEYKTLAHQVNELVGRINGNYGTLEYSPVHYINQSLKKDELFAIYNVADVCLVTSVRDGMNLVSHEYVAAQNEPREAGIPPKEGPGVLVLSEFAGSAQSLSGVIRVNPWNTEQLADALHQALNMSQVERELRQFKLYRYVMVHTASFWCKSFLQEFREVCSRDVPGTKQLPYLPTNEVIAAYRSAKNRLIISDYDGTLVQLQSLPQLAGPPPVVTNIINGLCQDPKNQIFIVSGRERRFMDTWLSNVRAGLAAEHGFYYRLPGDGHWQCIGRNFDLSWKDVVYPIMQYFTERTPGTYVENKESSLTWHYRDADPHFGIWQAKDMQIHVEDVLSNMPLEILQGSKMVEVRHQAANKGAVTDVLLQLQGDGVVNSGKECTDFVLCLGDDKSDEDMFQTIKKYKEEYVVSENNTMQSSFNSDERPNLAEKIASLQRIEVSSSGGGTSMTTSVSMPELSRRPILAPNAKVYSVHIGPELSQAEYKVDNLAAIRALLRKLQQISLESKAAE